MLFRFIGEYTCGRTTVPAGGVVFKGREPADVTDPDGIRRLSGSPEFEKIDPLDHDGDGEKGGSLPKVARKRRNPA